MNGTNLCKKMSQCKMNNIESGNSFNFGHKHTNKQMFMHHKREERSTVTLNSGGLCGRTRFV